MNEADERGRDEVTAACDYIRYGQPRGRMEWLTGLEVFAWVVGGSIAPVALSSAQPSLLLALLPAVACELFRRLLRAREALGAGEVRAGDGGLHINGRRAVSVARRRIRWGAARGTEIDFETDDARRITLKPRRAEDVQRLLDATGTGVDQRAVVLPLRATIGPFVTGLLVFMLLLVPLNMIFMALLGGLGATTSTLVTIFGSPAASLALALLYVRWFARPTVSIGIDGVLVRRRLRRRFIRYEDIDGVQPLTGAPYVLRLRLGTESVDLPIVGWSDEDVERALARMDAAREAVRGDATPEAALARNEETVGEWRERLRRLLSADAGFRQRRLTPEDTRRVLGDPAAALETRVGAALALREVEPERASKRIRFAAEAAADTRVRVALLSTLEDDDAATEAALAELRQVPRDRRSAR